MKPLPRMLAFCLLAALPWMAGCDRLGIEAASDVAARKEAEGKAVGGACRHAGRAIEDCYALNKAADKGAVFAGWREMNDYMQDKKIAEVPPKIEPAQPGAGGKSAHGKAAQGEDDDAEDAPAAKPARKVAKH